jgi:hypothetical protein
VAESGSQILPQELFHLAKGAEGRKDGNTITGGNNHSESKAREIFLGIYRNSAMPYYSKPLPFHLNSL